MNDCCTIHWLVFLKKIEWLGFFHCLEFLLVTAKLFFFKTVNQRKKKFSTDVVCVWCIRHIFAVHCLKPREFINSQVAAKEGSSHISQAGLPVPWLGDVLGQPLSSLVFGWLWRKGNFFKLKGCSCFSPDSICYLITLIVWGSLFARNDESWSSAAASGPQPTVLKSLALAQTSERGTAFGKESELPPFTLGKAKQLSKYHLLCEGPLWAYFWAHLSQQSTAAGLQQRAGQWAWAPARWDSLRMLLPPLSISQERQIKQCSMARGGQTSSVSSLLQ